MKKEISYYELSKKYVPDAVLFNNLPQIDEDWAYYGFIASPMLDAKINAEQEENEKKNGEDAEPISVYDYAENIYQTYIISDDAARNLYNHTSELISYSKKLDAFFWHVCHFGTSWSGVHTEIEDDPADYEWSIEKIANNTY